MEGKRTNMDIISPFENAQETSIDHLCDLKMYSRSSPDIDEHVVRTNIKQLSKIS